MKRFIAVLFATALLGGASLGLPTTASAQVSVGISVHVGPPALPVYPQPIGPGPGYLWTPGYWAYGPYGYYWVPGAWVLAPQVGLLWTPGWWGWRTGFYWWHPGYWGPRVGFYGGINYGYGYAGVGYVGGYWRSGAFYYNRAVSNVNVTYVHNTYNQTVVNNTTVNRVSYNGGQGGITTQPTAEQEAYAREQHVAPTATQMHQERLAMNNPAQRFTQNHGQPQIAATTRAGQFKGRGVVRMNHNTGSYNYRPTQRDQAFYRSQRHATEPHAEHNGNSNMERHAGHAPHPQERAYHPNRKRHPGGPPFF